MLYAGLDYHKRYSVVQAMDEQGNKRERARLPNEFEAVKDFFDGLGEPCKVVLEAGWNWGTMFDWLEQVESVEEVQLAHPYRVKAIASAQVKTDSVDAATLAHLLRTDLIPKAHIPCAETRRLKEIVRQRLFLVRLRTVLKNRLHALLDRHHVAIPAVSDLFGKRGLGYLAKLQLPEGAQAQLDQDLRLLQMLNAEVKESEAVLRRSLKGDRRVELLETVPGIGAITAAVVALEIDEVKRFPDARKLAAYAGLVPSVHASGGTVHHGRLMKQSNKWLRWALVEAAWVAVRNDPYFRTTYGRHARKGAQTAIIATARRLLEVVWHILSEDRPYEVRNAQMGTRGTSPAALISG
ncbi:MAG: IS110 family transposase [Acidobacteriota bacterium]